MKGPFVVKTTIVDGSGKEFAAYIFTIDKQEDLANLQKTVSDAMNGLGLAIAKGK